VKRPRGRPKGAKNRYSRDARALLAQRGPAAVGVLLNAATGKAIWGASEHGRKQRLVADLEQQLAAARWVGERLLPVLRQSEVTAVSANLNMNIGDDSPDNFDLAKQLAHVFNKAIGEDGGPALDLVPAEPQGTAAR
jgi:hypothetical protein